MDEGSQARRQAGELDLVGVYLSEIGHHALLDRDDEARLAQAIEGGTPSEREDARRQLAEANLRLVVSVAKRYRRPGVPLMDLVQAGNIGLMRAVDGFDWRLGHKFSTYATWWVRQAVIAELGDAGRALHVPSHLRAQVFGLARARDRLAAQLGREPALAELAGEAGVAPERVQELLALGDGAVSLSLPLGDTDAELLDVVADRAAGDPGDIAADRAERLQVHGLLEHLSEHQADVLRRRYGLDGKGARSLAEVGRELGISRERARQIEARALRALARHRATRAMRPAS